MTYFIYPIYPIITLSIISNHIESILNPILPTHTLWMNDIKSYSNILSSILKYGMDALKVGLGVMMMRDERDLRVEGVGYE